MKLIDADALIEKCVDWYVEEGPEEGFIGTIKRLIDAQPAVEAPDINVGNMDAISRQAAIDALRKMQTYKLFAGDDMLLIDQAEAQTELMMLPPVQPEIIRCKDCKYYKYGICMKIGANKSFHGFCDWAERGEQE